MNKIIYRIFFSIGILISAIGTMGFSESHAAPAPSDSITTVKVHYDTDKLYFSDVISAHAANDQLYGAHYSHRSHSSHSSHSSHYSHVSSR